MDMWPGAVKLILEVMKAGKLTRGGSRGVIPDGTGRAAKLSGDAGRIGACEGLLCLGIRSAEALMHEFEGGCTPSPYMMRLNRGAWAHGDPVNF